MSRLFLSISLFNQCEDIFFQFFLRFNIKFCTKYRRVPLWISLLSLHSYLSSWAPNKILRAITQLPILAPETSVTIPIHTALDLQYHTFPFVESLYEDWFHKRLLSGIPYWTTCHPLIFTFLELTNVTLLSSPVYNTIANAVCLCTKLDVSMPLLFYVVPCFGATMIHSRFSTLVLSSPVHSDMRVFAFCKFCRLTLVL